MWSSAWHPKWHLDFASEQLEAVSSASTLICLWTGDRVEMGVQLLAGIARAKNTEKKEEKQQMEGKQVCLNLWEGRYMVFQGQCSSSRPQACHHFGSITMPRSHTSYSDRSLVAPKQIVAKNERRTAHPGKRCQWTESFGEDLSFEKTFGENPKRPSRYTCP